MKQRILDLAGCVLALAIAPTAMADSTRLTFGTYISTGDYGRTTDTDIQSLSFAIRHKTGRWTLKASTAYLKISGSSNVLPGGESTAGAATTRNRQGMGDLNLSVANLAYYDKQSRTGLSLRGKVKVPTADEGDGLGTGEFDYTVELAPFTMLGDTTLFGALGYKVYGDTNTTNYRNVWLGRAGFSHRINPKHSAGLSTSYRQKTTATRDDRQNVMAFHTYKFSKTTKLQTYLIKGLTDATADIAGGLSLMHEL